MKKLSCILLLVCLFFALNIFSSLAEEEFSIRNGIKFGLSMEEVKNIEKENGFLPSSEKEDSLYYSGFQVANVDSGITYSFTDGFLSKVMYSHRAEEDYESVFVLWEVALRHKYGNPMWSSNTNSICPIRIDEGKLAPNTTMTGTYSSWKVEGYHEWLIPVNSGFLKVEISKGNQRVSLTGLGVYNLKSTFIEYSMFTTVKGTSAYEEYGIRESNATLVPSPSPTPATFGIEDSL